MNDKHEKRYWCYKCLSSSYQTEEQLNKHLELCNNHEAVAVKMPTKYNPEVDKVKKDSIKFKNFQNTFKHPVAVYLDFESTLEKVKDRDDKDIKEDSTTKPYQKHVANSCGIKFNCIHNEYSKDLKIINNSNEDILLEETIIELEELALYSYNLFNQNKTTYKLSDTTADIHNKTMCCYECKKQFSDDNIKVIHHDHITGNYISSICNNCNLNFKLKPFLPIYIHNLKGYDSHFLIPALARFGYQETKEELISAIPCNEEKYIIFQKKIKVDVKKGNDKEMTKKQKWHIDNNTPLGKKLLEDDKDKTIYFEIRFLDTIAFMPSSLCELVNNLNPKNDEIKTKNEIFEKLINDDLLDENKKIELINDFHNNIKLINLNQIKELREIYKNTSLHFEDNEEFLMMITKGIYPYDYISSYDNLNEIQLPRIEDFYSNLTNEECSLTDYTKAQIVYNKFSCKTLLDYHNIYLSSDVLLLADVFETFKNVCYKIYNLDVSYYYTSPGLSWDAFLKHTNEQYIKDGKGEFEIDLLTDMDMYLFVESGIRGGLSQISKRYAKANNKYMSDYKPSKDNKDDSYILYLDANNLYGYGMSAYLPKSDFKWNTKTWTNEKF